MSQIAFRCHYCYRVHTMSRGSRGDDVECRCGQLVRVPDTDTPPDTPIDLLPLSSDPRSGEPGESGWEELDSTASVPEHGEDREAGSPTEVLSVEPAEMPEMPEMPEVPARAPEPGEFDLASEYREPVEDDTGFVEALEEEEEEEETDRITTTAAPVPPGAKKGSRRARARRKTPKTEMSKGYAIAALIALIVWIVHTSPWMYWGVGPEFLQRPLPEVLGIVDHTHYLHIERAFWSAFLGGLVICLIGESVTRSRRARALAD